MEAGIKRVVRHIPNGVEVTTRQTDKAEYVFVQNFNQAPVEIKLPTDEYQMWMGSYDGTIGRFSTVILKK